jgi:hypothetical protein
MNKPDPDFFHRLYGEKSSRLVYRDEDFGDYVLMNVLAWCVAAAVYGPKHPLSLLVLALCTWMVGAFVIRHRAKAAVPLLVRRPQEILYMVAYKLQNMRLAYVIAAVVLVAGNYLIDLTPGWPHHAALMRKIGFGLFYTHLAALSLYRTALLVSHLRHRDHVRRFLMETSWRAQLARQPNITIEIVHAYFTGLLTHVLLVAPWYFAISHFRYSLVLLPATIAAGFFIHSRFLRVVNEWFYRDHWLGHHSELDFLYLHGPHHDAIPSGLIGVSGNGYLEGVLRHAVGGPGVFYDPVVVFLIHSFDVKVDIDGHQYIPGIYPNIPKDIQLINQHSTHHFGKLEPYSLGLKVDQPGVPEELARQAAKVFNEQQRNAVRLDEELTGFEWDNPRYRQYLALYDKYLVAQADEPSAHQQTFRT